MLENEILHLELKPAQSYFEKRETLFVGVLQDGFNTADIGCMTNQHQNPCEPSSIKW